MVIRMGICHDDLDDDLDDELNENEDEELFGRPLSSPTSNSAKAQMCRNCVVSVTHPDCASITLSCANV